MNKKTIIYSIKSALPAINLWLLSHTLACGIKATFHLINTKKNDI